MQKAQAYCTCGQKIDFTWNEEILLLKCMLLVYQRWPPAEGCSVNSRYVKELFQDAGLKIHEDPMGNIFGRWEGSDSSAGKTIR